MESDFNLHKQINYRYYQEMPAPFELVIDLAAKAANIHPDLIISETRIRRVVIARQVAMVYTYYTSRITLSKIGDEYGGRDHATVLHALRVFDTMPYYPEFREVFNQFIKLISLTGYRTRLDLMRRKEKENFLRKNTLKKSIANSN
mgnify:FL=1